MKLYELADQYQSVLSKIDEGIPEDVIRDTLESLEGDISDKVESMAKMIKSIEGEEKIFETEEKRLYDRRKTLENHRISIRNYIGEQLIKTGIEKIKGQVFTVAMQDNPPSVAITGTIPQNYYIPQPATVDRRKLIEDLKEGIKVENAELVKTRSVRIR